MSAHQKMRDAVLTHIRVLYEDMERAAYEDMGHLTEKETDCFLCALSFLEKLLQISGDLPATRNDRNADRIDGYDRDDLGESPDY